MNKEQMRLDLSSLVSIIPGDMRALSRDHVKRMLEVSYTRGYAQARVEYTEARLLKLNDKLTEMEAKLYGPS